MQFAVNALCDNITPLGFPVDPEVYCINAGVSGSRLQTGSFSSSQTFSSALTSSVLPHPSTTHISQPSPCASNNFNLVNFNAVAIFGLHTTPEHSFASIFKNSYFSFKTHLDVVIGSIGCATHGAMFALISAKNTGNHSIPGSYMNTTVFFVFLVASNFLSSSPRIFFSLELISLAVSLLTSSSSFPPRAHAYENLSGASVVHRFKPSSGWSSSSSFFSEGRGLRLFDMHARFQSISFPNNTVYFFVYVFLFRLRDKKTSFFPKFFFFFFFVSYETLKVTRLWEKISLLFCVFVLWVQILIDPLLPKKSGIEEEVFLPQKKDIYSSLSIHYIQTSKRQKAAGRRRRRRRRRFAIKEGARCNLFPAAHRR